MNEFDKLVASLEGMQKKMQSEAAHEKTMTTTNRNRVTVGDGTG